MSREQPRTRLNGWDKPQPEAIYGWMKNNVVNAQEQKGYFFESSNENENTVYK